MSCLFTSRNPESPRSHVVELVKLCKWLRAAFSIFEILLEMMDCFDCRLFPNATWSSTNLPLYGVTYWCCYLAAQRSG